MNFFTKIFGWIMLNLASILGLIQAIIKLGKEIVTALINFCAGILIVFPNAKIGGFQVGVLAVRAFIEKIDAWVESMKVKLLPPIV